MPVKTAKKGRRKSAYRNKKINNSDHGLIFEALEPRLLLSADLAGAAAQAAMVTEAAVAEAQMQASAAEELLIEDDILVGTFAVEDQPENVVPVETEKAQDPVSASEPSPPYEVVFVDTGVENYQLLLDDLQKNTQTRNLEVILLDHTRDGIAQITDTLSQKQDIDAIHILSHGTDGAVKLGNSSLSLNNVSSYAGQLLGWRDALASDADVLFYGCDLVSNVDGQELVESLSTLTGADVAASIDNTGHVNLGGDWDLEYQTGLIESSIAVSQSAQQAWGHILGVVANQQAWTNLAANTDTTKTISATHTVTATPDTDRLLLVTMVTRFSADQTINVTTATFGGVALHSIETGSDPSTRTGVWMGYLLDSEIPSGAQTLTVTYTSSTDPTGKKLLAATYSGVDQTTPINDSSSKTTKADAPISFGSQIDYQAGGEVVYVASFGGTGNLNTTEPAGYSNIYTNELSGSLMTTISHKDDTSGDGNSPGTTAVDFGGTDQNHSLAVVALNPVLSTATTTTFQEGVSGYSSTVDTFVDQLNPNDNNSADTTIQVDLNDGANDTAQALIRFDNIIGGGAGQIPDNVYISSASLTVNVTNLSSTGANIAMHEMLVGWSDTDTWNSMSGGISTNGVEAKSTATSILANPDVTGSVSFTGLESSIQSWLDGATNNNGWVIDSNNTNGWDFDSSEGGTKPLLSVSYITAGSQASTVHTLTVDTANDALDGDATSIDTLLANKGADGKISLREAIWATNNTTNVDASTPDVINFSIGSGAQTIFVNAGGLPTITDEVILDATSQPGYVSTPLITLEGTSATGSTGGIVLRTNNSTVSGFIVQNFPDEGIEIDGSTGFGDNNIIEDNWVGISSAGAAAGNLDDGILVSEDADNNTLRNNIVGSSGGDGIHIRNNSDGNWVWGNTIGLGSDGLSLRANTGHGIHLSGTATGNNIGTDGNSVNDIDERNIISGNLIHGVNIDATSSGNEIAGNWIGTAGTGTTGIGNANTGIYVQGANTIIGGTGTNDGNVITNSGNEGITIAGSSATGTNIQGNIIGLDPDGATGSGNVDVGIALLSGAHNTIIGGTTPGARNVISNNFEGIEINSNNNIVQGNYIGTDITGLLDRGNRSDDGIEILNNGTGNLIGGTETGAGNLIAFNALDGVNIASGISNTILGNEIHSNVNHGIDLGNNGVTTNDANDVDAGANDLQNYPVISQADLNGTNLTMSGTIDTDGPLNTQYRIEIFGNATGTQDTTHGEGRYYLGTTTVTVNASGDGTFTGVVLPGVTLSVGDFVTATATRIDDPGQVGVDDQLAYGDSSEFAANFAIAPGNSDPVVTFGGGNVTYVENDPAIFIDATATVTDADATDFNGGVLTVNVTANGSGDDRIRINNEGMGAGQVGMTTSPNEVYYGGALIGTWSGSGAPLAITFNSAADATAVEAVVQNITFENLSDAPSTLTRTVQFQLTDGDGGTSTAITKDINVTALNDDPTNAGTLPTDISVTEDVSSNVDLSAVDFSDVDAATGSLTVTLTTATGGNLTAAAGTGITLGGTATARTLSGTLTDLNNYFNTASNITYLHGTAHTNGDNTDTIQVEINDNGNTGTGGGTDINLGTVNVDISAVNDDPTNAGSLPSDISVTEDVSSNVDLSAVDFSDVDAASGSLTVTLTTSTGGNLTAAAGTGITLGGTATVRTISGNLTDLNNYFNTASNITYLHGTAHTNGNDADTIQVEINDNGNTGTGGGTDIDLGTVNVDISAVNDDPTNAGSLPSDISVTEDVSSNVDLSAVDFSDVDAASGSLTVTLTTATGGNLTAAAGTGITLGGTATARTLSGTLTDLNNYFNTASNITYLHGTAHTNGDNTDTIQVNLNDNGNTGTGGGTDIDLGTVNVDISAVNDDPTNAGSLPSDISVTEDVASNVDLSAVDFSDVDAASGSLTVTLTTSTGGDLTAAAGTGITLGGTATARTISGTLTDLNNYFNTASNITYLHGTAHTNGDNTDTIQVNLNDNGNTGTGGGTDIDLGTVNVDISAVNDDPTNAGSLPSDISVTEDVSSNVDLSAVDFSDVDAASGSLTVTLTTSTGGNLTAAAGTGITLGGTATVRTISGNLTDLNNYFNTASNITYLHGTAHTNGNDADTIQVNLNDNGNTGTGGGTDIDLGTVNVDISAVNDDPTNAGTLPTDISVTEDVSSNVDLSAVDFSDVDAASGSLTVTLTTATGGNLTAAAGTGITLGGTATARTISGTLTDLNNYFNTASNITYLHGTAHTNGDNTDTIQVNLNDNGNTGTGGGTDIDLGTVNVDISAVNDDPTNAGTLPTDISVTEDVASNVDLSAVDFSDVDAATGSLTVTLTTSTGGDLTAAAGTGITLGGTATARTISGTLTDLNNYFNTASNITYLHGTPGTNGDNADTIQVNLNDNGNTGTGGGTDIDLGTVNVDIAAVNDDPTNAGTLPTDISVTEDVSSNVDLSAVDFSDVDAASGSLTVTLTTSTGGDLTAAAGTGITLGGTATARTISGTLTDLNNYFNTASNITYLHGTAHTNGNDADTIQVNLNDNGNTGTGGGTDIDLGTVNVDISAVNDDPTNAGSLPTDISVTEDVSSNVDLSAVDFSDVDAASGSLTVTLTTSTGGDLTAAAGTGITLGGTPTARTISGTLTDLNNYFNTASNITYLHGTAHTNGDNTDTIQVNLNDNGNTGTGGGTDIDLGTVNVDISAVNDDPTNAGTLPTDISVTEDVSSNVDLSAVDFSDVDAASGSLTVTLTTSTGGNLTAAAGTGITLGGTATALTISGNLTDLNNYFNTASNITYLHGTAHTNGNDADTIQVNLNDNGNTGTGGGTDIDLGTVNVDISAVNDDPTNAGSLPTDISVTEDVSSNVDLSAVDFSDVDAASGSLTVTLTTSTGGDLTAAAGTGITLGGTATARTISGTLTDLNNYFNTASNITYLHGTAHTNGDNTDTIQVNLNDNGNTGTGGGTDIDLGTVNVDISAVNDDPTNAGTLPTDISVTEDVSSNVDLSAVDFSDVDAASGSLTVTLTTSTGGDLTAAAGTGITLGGTATARTISGNLTDLNNYFNTASNITYLHGTAHTNGNDADTIQVNLNDNGNTGTGGGTDIDLGTVNVDISAVNDDPTNAGSLPTDISVTEDVSSNVDLSAVDFSDVDAATGSLTVTLTTSTGGDLTAAAGTGITLGGTATARTISGTLTDLNNYFNTASNITYLHGTAHTNGNDADTIQVEINDNGNTGTGGGTDINLGTVNVDISAVNDDPTNAGSLPTDISVTEDVSSNVDLSAVDFSDVDAATGSLTVTLTTSTGGNLSAAAGTGITLGGTATARTISGTLTDLNNYFNTASNITYLHGTAHTNGNDADTIQVNLNDNGNTGTGGGTDINLGTVNVDISAVNDDPTNAGTLPTDISVTEDVSSNVDLSAVDFSDVDAATGSLTVTLTTSTGGNLSAAAGTGITLGGTATARTISGTLTDLNNYFNTASNITYLHGTPGTNGDNTDTIQVNLNDNGNTGAGGGTDIDLGTVNVDIAAVNDDPTNAGTLPTDISVTEDVSSNVDLSAVDFSDVDAASGSLTVTLTTSTGGNLTAAAGTGITLGGTATALTISGNLTDLNNYFNTASNITYLHGTAHTNGDNTDTIQVNLNDNGNTGTGGGTDINLGTVNVDISAVNDDPTNAGTLPTDISVTEDVSSNVDLSAVDFSDVDAATGSLTVTLTTSTGGNLSAAAGTGITLGGTATARTISGTLTDLNNYFNTASNITYLHGTPGTNGDNADTIQVNLNDNGNTGTGGGTDINLGTVNVDISAVNDDPTNAGSLPTDISVTEDVSSNVDLSAVDFSDVDAASGSLTVTLTTSTGGNLSAAAGTGITLGGTATALTISGNLTDLNNYFNTASNITYLHGTPGTNGNDADTIQVNLNDNGNTGTGGGTDINLGTVNVDISAVNDDPTNAGSLPSDISVTEDVSSNVDLSAVDFSDVDAASGSLTVTLTTSTGGNLSAAAGTGITLGGTATARTISGTLTDLNNYFNTASNITYLHGTAHTNGDNADTIQIEINDNGNTGTGGGTDINLGTVNVDISAINDAPVVSAPGAPLSATEQTNLSIEGTGFSVSDVDEAGAGATATLSVGEGAITVAAGDSGVSINGGNGTGSVTLSGTIAQINNLLTGGGTGTITYLNNSQTPSASTTFTVTVNDQGNTGTDPGASGGPADEQGTNNVIINITAVNDPHVVVIPGNQEIAINSLLVFSMTNGNALSISDIDAGNNPFVITLSVTNGGLSLAQTTNLTFLDGDGSHDQSLTFSGTMADINAALNGLSFTPDHGLTGTTSIQFEVHDPGSAEIGSPVTSVHTIAITVTRNEIIIEPPPQVTELEPVVNPVPAPEPDPEVDSPETDEPEDVVQEEEPASNPGEKVSLTTPGINEFVPTYAPDSDAAPIAASVAFDNAVIVNDISRDIASRLQIPSAHQQTEMGANNEFTIDPGLLRELDLLNQELSNQLDQEKKESLIIKHSAEIGGVMLIAGAVKWLMQAGSLFASLLGTLPAWRWVDPLPVLVKSSDDEEAELGDRPQKQVNPIKKMLTKILAYIKGNKRMGLKRS